MGLQAGLAQNGKPAAEPVVQGARIEQTTGANTPPSLPSFFTQFFGNGYNIAYQFLAGNAAVEFFVNEFHGEVLDDGEI